MLQFLASNLWLLLQHTVGEHVEALMNILLNALERLLLRQHLLNVLRPGHLRGEHNQLSRVSGEKFAYTRINQNSLVQPRVVVGNVDIVSRLERSEVIHRRGEHRSERVSHFTLHTTQPVVDSARL